jgi:hypothetical protein
VSVPCDITTPEYLPDLTFSATFSAMAAQCSGVRFSLYSLIRTSGSTVAWLASSGTEAYSSDAESAAFTPPVL